MVGIPENGLARARAKEVVIDSVVRVSFAMAMAKESRHRAGREDSRRADELSYTVATRVRGREA